jgi:eukaryotic-like serine/threonine-protein kinase
LLCYRCGSHVPDTSESCGTCGQKLAGGGVRQATATFSRKRLQGGPVEGAPYKTGDVLAGRYEIDEPLGAGPVGVVFRAHDREVDVDIALKVVNPRLVQTPEERKQFAKQLRVARKLSHQNLVRVYEDGEDQQRPFYTMQLLEGLTLRKIIDLRVSRGEFFKVAEIEPIIGQIAAALDGANRLGPHGNLKPENVIVLPDLLKVGGFGLSLAIPRLPFLQAVRQCKADRYLPPEYSEGAELDLRADVYALGAIVGEMLCGLTPDGAVPELGRRNPEVPHQLEGLYRRALNSNPLARPKTAGVFFEEFADIAHKLSPPPLRPRSETTPVPAVERERPRPPSPTVELRKPVAEKPAPPVFEEHLSEPTPISLSVETDVPSGAPAVTGETAMLPSYPAPAEPLDEDLAEPTMPRRIPRFARPGVVFFAVFTVAGLALGAAAGYWLLGRARTSPPVTLAAPGIAEAAPGPAEPPPTVEDGPEVAAAPDPQDAPDADADSEPEPQPEPRRPTVAAPSRPSVARPAKADVASRPAVEQPPRVEEAPAPPTRVAPEGVRVALASAPGPAAQPCPDGMRHVPAGAFRMGTARDDPMMGFDEKVLGPVEVGAFCIDVYEYPNQRGVAPRVNVTWSEAVRLCEARGKRLCAEEEWEKACKGPGSARYPYGNTFDAEACNTEDEDGEDRPLASAGRFGRCRSGYGVMDLSGNVAEWTASNYGANADKTHKGGSSTRPDYAARCSARKNGPPTSRAADLGLRCCADPP